LSLSVTRDTFVAIRSSAREEDTEAAARAGEFDTFLFVRGADAVLDHLRLAWAGLWTERAIHNRALLGSEPGAIGGGALVQRMVDARVSGVLHTVNVAGNRPREMLVNAGLGLGEGVVSGMVAADEITVAKDEALAGDDLHFRYVTRDKRERVIFNARAGLGTVRVETLYHQRLRPALEYVELCELVHSAARLEAAFGHPLDIEFAIEGADLRLLQVRPVPTALAVWRETMDRYPIPTGGTP
jgi:pyruvate,water dikinase